RSSDCTAPSCSRPMESTVAAGRADEGVRAMALGYPRRNLNPLRSGGSTMRPGAFRAKRPRARKTESMKTPARLQSLIDEGLIDTVVRQLMSGKEAKVYVVRSGTQTRCAK